MKQQKEHRPTEPQLRLLIELSEGPIHLCSRKELGWGRWRAQWRIASNVVERGWALRCKSELRITGAGRAVLSNNRSRVNELWAEEEARADAIAAADEQREAEVRMKSTPEYRRDAAVQAIQREEQILYRFRTELKAPKSSAHRAHLDREIDAHTNRLHDAKREHEKAIAEIAGALIRLRPQ